MMQDRPVEPDSAFAADENAAPPIESGPLSAEQALAWRERQVPLSVWHMVAGQAVAGSLATGLTWLFSGRAELALSVGYGALAVLLPACVLLAGACSWRAATAGARLAQFFVGELVKIGLTVALLLAAPRLLPQLSWLALLTGLIVALKAYWVALWLHPARRERKRI